MPTIELSTRDIAILSTGLFKFYAQESQKLRTDPFNAETHEWLGYMSGLGIRLAELIDNKLPTTETFMNKGNDDG